MALSDIERERVERAVEIFMKKRRPPPAIRQRLDLGFRIVNQSVELFEIRPVWDNPAETLVLPFAKGTYDKTNRLWKVYWMRADLKWHKYPPTPKVAAIEEFLEIVDRDEQACFFG